MSKEEISIQIQDIFNQNELSDLKDFLKRLDRLNKVNVTMSYFFHAAQSSGILVTTIAAGFNSTSLIWLGVVLNSVATLLHVFEKNNNEIITKLSQEIKAIKEGNYIDQSTLIDTDETKFKSDLNLTNMRNTNNSVTNPTPSSTDTI